MKRYFIFGFLTILIITLNFAFIIILTSDHEGINYSFLFILWIVVVLASIGLAWMEKNKKRKIKKTLKTPKDAPPEEKFRPTEEQMGPSIIYKKKEVKKFRLNLVPDLISKVEAGFFGGYVTTEEYANESVQAVYTQQNQLLGYISKKDVQLCQNLEQLYKEPIICWGKINWNEPEKTFQVKGHIPVLYSEHDINRFRKLTELKSKLLQLEKPSTDFEAIAFLQKAEHFHYFQQAELTPNSLDYSIDPKILPQLAKKLNEAQQWEELLKLKEFPVLINRLDPETKKEVKSAINTAYKNIQK